MHVWASVYQCLMCSIYVCWLFMWMKAWIKSVHHIQQSCVFRTLVLNGSIHMDFFYELFEASHFGEMDRNLIQNTFICLSKMNKSHPEVKMIIIYSTSCCSTLVWRSFLSTQNPMLWRSLGTKQHWSPLVCQSVESIKMMFDGSSELFFKLDFK